MPLLSLPPPLTTSRKKKSIPIRKLKAAADEVSRLYPTGLILALNLLWSDWDMNDVQRQNERIVLIRRMLE